MDEQGEYSREETRGERLDRNFDEQLQEARIAQAGVQILFAFLLTLPFQQRFETLTDFQRSIYLGTLLAAAIAVVLFTAPVAVHRVLFRQGLKDFIVDYTSKLASVGLVALALSVVGGLVLVLDVLISHTLAIWLGVSVALLTLVLWLIVPLVRKRRIPPQDDTDE
jgi:high-affinity Fe2+/Pb2+ permease